MILVFVGLKASLQKEHVQQSENVNQDGSPVHNP